MAIKQKLHRRRRYLFNLKPSFIVHDNGYYHGTILEYCPQQQKIQQNWK
jgi:hypothetical protein